jgi:hypothetical protein
LESRRFLLSARMVLAIANAQVFIKGIQGNELAVC